MLGNTTILRISTTVFEQDSPGFASKLRRPCHDFAQARGARRNDR